MQESCTTRPLASSSRQAPPVRRRRRGSDQAVFRSRGIPRGQRVLDVVSRSSVGGCSWAALEIAWFEIGLRSNSAMYTYRIATTSPSHHDCSQQVVLSRVSQIQPYQPPERPSAFVRRICADLSCSTPARHECLYRREISTQNPITHIAMGHDPTIAWKAPPTRTPPPICTSAPFLKPRWSQDRGRREQLRNTRWTISRNPFERKPIASLCECCNAAVVCLESKFLNPRAESGVS